VGRSRTGDLDFGDAECQTPTGPHGHYRGAGLCGLVSYGPPFGTVGRCTSPDFAVEGSGIGEIAWHPNLAVEFDVLTVAQMPELLARLRVEGHLRASVAVEFQNEALAFAGDCRRLHHTAADDDGFPPGRFDFGPGVRGV
jgi:hypothetical protein